MRLRGFDLTIEPGSFVVVIGTNGSGKSTTLNAVAGSFGIDSGTIRPGRPRYHGLARTPPREADWPRLPGPARRHLPGPVDRREPRPGRRPGPAARARPRVSRRRIAELRDRVRPLGMGLEDRLDNPIGTLSGGQRQALTLLMATYRRPELLLLDEHTAALDPRSAEQVIRLTEQVVRAISAHDHDGHALDGPRGLAR